MIKIGSNPYNIIEATGNQSFIYFILIISDFMNNTKIILELTNVEVIFNDVIG
mgnify:CR=1 FL=1